MSTTKKGVILIHGMGEHKKNDTVVPVVNSFVDWMNARGKHEVSVEPDLKDTTTDDPSTITVRYSGQEWKFVEVWWEKSFDPPPLQAMFSWAAIHLCSHLIALFGSFLKKALFAIVIAILSGVRLVVGLFFFFYYVATVAVGGIIYLRSYVNPAVTPQFTRDTSGRTSVTFKSAQTVAFDHSRRLKGRLDVLRDRVQRPFRVVLLEDMDRLEPSPKLYLYWLWAMWEALQDFLSSSVVWFLFMLGVVLIIPLMALMWAVSLLRNVPGLPSVAESIVKFISGFLDSFLVGSLGDIEAFLHSPVNGRKIRDRLEKAIDLLRFDCESVHIICHSTGTAVAYETLALESNHGRAASVHTLATLGSILNWTWKIRHRPGFDRGLPKNIKWLNFVARYDPATEGLINKRYPAYRDPSYAQPDNIPVTNEDDFLSDHSCYWTNYEQVIARLTREIWGAGNSDLGLDGDAARTAVVKRKRRLIALSVPRLLSSYALPVLFPLFVFRHDLAQNVGHFVRLNWVASLIKWEWLAKLVRPPVDTLAAPVPQWQWIVFAAIVAALITVLGMLAYRAYKTVVWQHFAYPTGVK